MDALSFWSDSSAELSTGARRSLTNRDSKGSPRPGNARDDGGPASTSFAPPAQNPAIPTLYLNNGCRQLDARTCWKATRGYGRMNAVYKIVGIGCAISAELHPTLQARRQPRVAAPPIRMFIRSAGANLMSLRGKTDPNSMLPRVTVYDGTLKHLSDNEQVCSLKFSISLCRSIPFTPVSEKL